MLLLGVRWDVVMLLGPPPVCLWALLDWSSVLVWSSPLRNVVARWLRVLGSGF